MTNEELLSVAEIVERATNRFNEQAARFRERSAAYDRLIAEMSADHEAKMAEHRASFGARTEADRQIIEGLRADVEDLRNRLNSLGIQAAKQANIALGMVEGEGLLCAAKRVVKERDALRAEVADLRGTFDIVHASLGIKPGDHIGEAIEAMKSQRTPTTKQHPVKVGEYVKDDNGDVCQVHEVYAEYLLNTGWTWAFENCTPCDPPADHDTPAGKEAAEAVIRDSQMTEIKAGDVVEVFQDTSKNTLEEEIGIIGRVLKVYKWSGEQCVILDPETQNRPSDYLHYALCDVRKVPQ